MASSQYLVRYLLIDVLKRFRRAASDIHVRISTMNELEVEETLRNDPEVSMGVAAPYEPSPDLDYHELFAMNWSLIAPPSDPFVGKRKVRLRDLVDRPLIIYERGSTGRQHILDAFHESGFTPQVALETTSTETIVSMVEAGLGIALVPLMPSVPSRVNDGCARGRLRRRSARFIRACSCAAGKRCPPLPGGCSISSGRISPSRRGRVTATLMEVPI